MKKGQAEIIGLVIVVLLLVFALIFFININSGDNDNETRLIKNNLRVNSALNALMKVNIDDKRQMKDLIQRCFFDNSQNDCDHANANLTYYLNEIENDGENGLFPGKNYNFTAYNLGGIPENGFNSFGKDCKNSIAASPYIFQSEGKVEFEICI